MENVEQCTQLGPFLHEHPDLTEKVVSDLRRIEAIIQAARKADKIKGVHEPVFIKNSNTISTGAMKHVLIEHWPQEPGEISYILLDPNY